MGLMLHANGRNFITNGQYREALKILDMGEVSDLILTNDLFDSMVKFSLAHFSVTSSAGGLFPM